jgi:hypothetical protein
MHSESAIATAAQVLVRAHADEAGLVAFERCKELFAIDDQEAAFAMIDVIMAIRQMGSWFGPVISTVSDIGLV